MHDITNGNYEMHEASVVYKKTHLKQGSHGSLCVRQHYPIAVNSKSLVGAHAKESMWSALFEKELVHCVVSCLLC